MKEGRGRSREVEGGRGREFIEAKSYIPKSKRAFSEESSLFVTCTLSYTRASSRKLNPYFRLGDFCLFIPTERAEIP